MKYQECAIAGIDADLDDNELGLGLAPADDEGIEKADTLDQSNIGGEEFITKSHVHVSDEWGLDRQYVLLHL